MTITERNNKLKHFIICLKCEVSGKHCDDNCSIQYDAGNMGEIIENLEAISKALEQDQTTKNNLGVDCISRQAVIDLMIQKWGENFSGDSAMQESIDAIRVLPSVTSQKPRCKECKWWKDSDGEYRRGCGAESKCPINRREVFDGNGYCFLFEPQESEG